MAQKPEVKFDKLFQKLYNIDLWLMAYEQIAPNPGNMTPGIDGKTIDGTGMRLVEEAIADLKAACYKPQPVRRTYIDKANGQHRPLGIPCFRDKLLQTVVKLILEAIYEPTFSDNSHAFRPNRSCHTALEQVKRMRSIRWWVEVDIKGFFDNLDHDVMLRILSRRIMDKRFLHLIEQFLRAGYVEDWKRHQTYSGTPQGGNLSPTLSNIYLNELDQMVTRKMAEFNRGHARRKTLEYMRVQNRKRYARKQAGMTGDWSEHKRLQQQLISMPATDPQDPNFRRLHFVRYADDFLVGIIGSKGDAITTKEEMEGYLRTELKLELSADKTLVTNAKKKVRFLGYDIQRWPSTRILKVHTTQGVSTRRTTTYHLKLLMPRDKVQAFARSYGRANKWQGESRPDLFRLSEPEILLIYNAEIRGFLNYYALADNLSYVASRLLWLTTKSFFKTLANKRKSSTGKVAKSLKTGPNTFVVKQRKSDGTTRQYKLIASTRQLARQKVTYGAIDHIPSTWVYRNRSELGQRLSAKQCEWCGTRTGAMEVHHVRKLKDLKGKAAWEARMIARQRKTLVLCKQCHVELHAGKLKEKETS
jgi:group II intron reverse transcriptase/maturase